MPKINEFLNVMKWVFVGIACINIIAMPYNLSKTLKGKK